MTTKFRLVNAFALAIFFSFTCSFANIKKAKQGPFFSNIRPIQEEILIIYKKTEKELDIYTFTPKNQLDKELMEAIENRLKVVTEQGVLSFSADQKNLVTIVIDPDTITEYEWSNTFNIIAQTYGYPSNHYKIIEL